MSGKDPYRGRPPQDEEPEYKVPKPIPSWFLRVVGAFLLLQFVGVAYFFRHAADDDAALVIGSGIVGLAGMFLLRGRIPWT